MNNQHDPSQTFAPAFQEEQAGMFTLRHRVIHQDGQPWLELVMELTPGGIRVQVQDQDGNGTAHAKQRAIGMALHTMAEALNEAMATREGEDEQ